MIHQHEFYKKKVSVVVQHLSLYEKYILHIGFSELEQWNSNQHNAEKHVIHYSFFFVFFYFIKH